MDGADLLERGRRSYDGHDWSAAHDALSSVASSGTLDADDLVRLATTVYLLGRAEEADVRFDEAFRRAVADGDVPGAVRAGFWASFVLSNRGENARAHGWGERCRRLVGSSPEPGPEERLAVELQGALLDLRDGRVDLAPRFADIESRARASGEPDLQALAAMGEGFCLVLNGRLADGMSRLDEVTVSLGGAGVHPLAAGLVYCVGLDVCHATMDLQRSALWTAELTRWCRAQPDLVPYRGQCLVHRVQVMVLRGSWAEAVEEVRRACDLLAGEPAVGSAVYEWAELCRLRGDLDTADERYTEAARLGHDPQPGLALLRLAQGRGDLAAAGLRRSLVEPQDSTVLPAVLAAYVEVLIGCGELDAAEEALGRLRETAGAFDVPMAGALAAHAGAQLALARGDAGTALRDGRRAWTSWHELEAPYHAARSRVVVGEACRALGDEDAARMELAAARSVFEELGAVRDLSHVSDLMGSPVGPAAQGMLSPREQEVLRLVAQGMTNRAIAAELFLSQKTVARHVSNIFGKTGVSTRTAAAAYAFTHHLV